MSTDAEAPEDLSNLYNELLNLVPPELRTESGEVFHSGSTAFEQPSPIYLLGFNPGGDPVELGTYTIGAEIDEARGSARRDWSAYADEAWDGSGARRYQRSVLHMLEFCELNPRTVPASNVIFVRSADVAALGARREGLLRSCWLVHQRAISALGVRVVVAFGKDAGHWVRTQLDADTEIDNYRETNKRGLSSTTHRGRDGIQVVTLTHPSRHDWTNPEADPTRLVSRALERDVAELLN